MTTSARGERAFADRWVAVLLSGSTVLACLVFWDKQGWDRATILGAHRFGLAMFALMIVGLMVLAFGVVIQQVASSIASERDRKSLDALLASRFSSAEIVVGAVATGLFRYANTLAAALPVVVLVVYLGGVAPIWAVLAGLGLVSTALMLAGFAVAASVGARTASRAVAAAMGWFGAWFTLPTLYVLLFRPFVWPGAPGWLTDGVIAVLDSGPMGLLMNVLGVFPRLGGPIGAVGRMVAWQLAWTLALVAWSTSRLRPASRSLYDVEGEQGRIRRLKAALRRPPRRPPCSDDPVFWQMAHSSRPRALLEKLAGRTSVLVQVGVVALGTWWFAGPAFAELAERGYGPSPEAFAMPELHPLMRMLIKARLPAFSASMFPGQARLEFNMGLRLLTGPGIFWFGITVFSVTFEAIKGERRRDTWLGLIATPLGAREILRGKALGALWKVRWAVFILVTPWTIGLVAGAVHPLGYLAAFAILGASGAFFAHLGLLMAFQEWDPETGKKSSVSPIHVPTAIVISVLLIVGPLVLAWASLLTYEDVAAAYQGVRFPELREGAIAEWVWARGVLVVLFVGIGSLALGACWLDRKNEREFDAAVGRPVRREGNPSR